jgi:hypothetical protein
MGFIDEIVRIPDYIVNGILSFVSMKGEQQDKILELIGIGIILAIAVMWYMN